MPSATPQADVVIATVGRFHYATLASQLHRLGRLQRFYSGFSHARLRCPDVPAGRVRSHRFPMTPVAALERLGLLGGAPLRLAQRWAQIELDRFIARDLPECAAYVALSGCAVESGAVALQRGIRHVCERASEHIESMDERLAAEHLRWGLRYPGIDPVMIERERIEYQQADRIIVMSQVSKDSFRGRIADLDKVIVVPPEVAPGFADVHRRRAPHDSVLRLLFVGQQSVRKGFGRLLRAFAALDPGRARLQIVGAPAPETPHLMPTPVPAGVVFLGTLPQTQLAQLYADADALIVPSIEDGLPTCALEALACGCPVLISDLAGSAQYVVHGGNGLVYRGDDDDALGQTLARLLDEPDLLPTLRSGVQRLGATWNRGGAYGVRWLEAIT